MEITFSYLRTDEYACCYFLPHQKSLFEFKPKTQGMCENAFEFKVDFPLVSSTEW